MHGLVLVGFGQLTGRSQQLARCPTEPAGYALDVAVDLPPREMLTLPCYKAVAGRSRLAF